MTLSCILIHEMPIPQTFLIKAGRIELRHEDDGGERFHFTHPAYNERIHIPTLHL